jgi:serine/threonine protein kinase
MSSKFQEIQVGYNKYFVDQRYSNLKPIGDGAYGFVASAYDSKTKQKVAIKKIKDAFR